MFTRLLAVALCVSVAVAVVQPWALAQEKEPAATVNQVELKEGNHILFYGDSLTDQAAPKKTALAPDQFDSLVQLILPAPERGETKWLEVAWMTNTLEARRKAAAEDKPIVVWSMSACPLGGD
jgi:hypothetical protein